MRIKTLEDTEVVLIHGGGKIYTDIAARFVRSERSLNEIVATPYDAKIVNNILSSGHLAATEFDYFIFGVSGYSRVCETQLVRKRMASYLIKSGRLELNGKRKFETLMPDGVADFRFYDRRGNNYSFNEVFEIIEDGYNEGLRLGFKEENLRYAKPQGTCFNGIIGMNAHALLDWFKIRCCRNAQWEIRHLANAMLSHCKRVAPDLFQHAGASCVGLGYCPENSLQNSFCVKTIPTHDDIKIIIPMLKKLGTQSLVDYLKNNIPLLQ